MAAYVTGMNLTDGASAQPTEANTQAETSSHSQKDNYDNAHWGNRRRQDGIHVFTSQFIHGKGAYELEERKNPEKEAGGDKSQSQTNEATVYSVCALDGTTIRILDTPGLADTRGVKQDEKHKAKINKAIEDHVTTLDAVIIMANGTVQRLGAATDYTLSIIAAMFPYSIIDNIGFIFTHTDPLTFQFQKGSLRPELRGAKHWLIQNPLAYYQSYKALEAEGASQALLRRGRRDLEQFYGDTLETLNEWLEWLDSRRVQPSKDINELYKMSNNIEANISRVLTAVERMHKERVKWEGFQRDLQNNERSKSALEDLIKAQTTPFWDREQTTYHNTLCTQPGCHSICHESCGLDFLLDIDALSGCATFTNGRAYGNPRQSTCDKCGHIARFHRHYNDKWVHRNKEMSPETKRDWDSAKTQEEKLKTGKAMAQRELDAINSDITSAQATIRTLIGEYNRISLSKNFAGHIHSAIEMLRHRKKALQSEPSAKADVDMIDDGIEQLRAKLKVIENQSRSSGSGIWDWNNSGPH